MCLIFFLLHYMSSTMTNSYGVIYYTETNLVRKKTISNENKNHLIPSRDPNCNKPYNNKCQVNKVNLFLPLILQ